MAWASPPASMDFYFKRHSKYFDKKKNKIKKINVKNKIFGYLLKKKELHAYKVLSKKILVLYLTTGFFSPKKDEYRTKMTKRELEILNFK